MEDTRRIGRYKSNCNYNPIQPCIERFWRGERTGTTRSNNKALGWDCRRGMTRQTHNQIHELASIHTCIVFQIFWYNPSPCRSSFYPNLISALDNNTYPRIRYHHTRNRTLPQLPLSYYRRKLQQRLLQKINGTIKSANNACDVSKNINRVQHTGETIFLLLIFYSVQHVTDIPNTAFRKFTVVRPIPARRRRKHDVISVETTWSTLGWEIVLQWKR